ncbi:hypothetical protein VTN00DRAFT_7224 [Thermoascus crustaceus]|uniref:uncharacterized protein n=1 Tax=Thermoascus crustaceus TaxID=5088 RepID=UPI0037427721
MRSSGSDLRYAPTERELWMLKMPLDKKLNLRQLSSVAVTLATSFCISARSERHLTNGALRGPEISSLIDRSRAPALLITPLHDDGMPNSDYRSPREKRQKRAR